MGKLLLTLFAVIMTANLTARAADDVQVIAEADFTLFTDGTLDSPKTLYTSDVKAKVPALNYASNVASAGGCLFVKSSGYIEFNAFTTLPSYSGCTIRVTAEVKMGDDYGGVLQLSKGYSGTPVNAPVYTDEWSTVTVLVPDFGNGSTTRLKIAPFLSVSGFYLKSVKIEYSPNFVLAPEAYLPNDADGTSFTASCSRVSGAASYEIDVFSLDENDNPTYFLQNEPITALSIYSDPSKKVTGLDPETKYFYVARAKNSSGASSENSEVVEVIKCKTSIEAPEALAATNITENGFTANWTKVNEAVSYIVNVYSKETLDVATDAVVFEEDFSGITEGTLSSISYPSRFEIDKLTKIPGWVADGSIAGANGFYVFYPTNGIGELVTPEINLSDNNGEFSVVVNAASGSFGSFFSTANTLSVDIVEGVEDEWTVVEAGEVKVLDNKNFTDYAISFTKGSASTRLRIKFTQNDNSYKLYIDDIKIQQTLPAGSVVDKQLFSNTVEEATSADIALAMAVGKEYYYDILSVGLTVIGSGKDAYLGELQSVASNRVKVDAGARIDAIAADVDAPKAWKAGEGVLGVNGSAVTVCDLAGRTIYKNVFPADSYTLNINVRGLVIVVVDGKAYKIVL